MVDAVGKKDCSHFPKDTSKNMNIMAGAQNLDIAGWARGLLGAGVSGGASAIAGGIVLPSLDSDHFSVLKAKFWIAIFALFCASAVVSIAKFLQMQPLPAMKTIETTKEIVREPQPGVVVTSTIKETHVEPAK